MTEFEKFVELMGAIGAKKTYDQYYEKDFVELSFDEMRLAGVVVRVDGYHRTDVHPIDIDPTALALLVSKANEHAAKYVGINTKLANLIVDQYKDAPYVLRIEQKGIETKVVVSVRQKDMELSLRNSEIWNDVDVLSFRVRLLDNNELFLIAKQGRVTRRRSFRLPYDPVAEPQRFLDEVMPWFEHRHEGCLRKATVSFPHTLTGEHQTRTEWYEVYPGDEADKAILGFRNCKVMMIDTLKIQQVVARDLFGVVNGLYDYHLSKDITETVFAFRLPDDFEPNGREFAEISMLAPMCVG
jgi:hypothetical protein